MTVGSIHAEDFLKKANDCLIKGDYKCVVINLRLLHEETGQDVSKRVAEAEECGKHRISADALFEENLYVKAGERYKKILDINPKDEYVKIRYDSCLEKQREAARQVEEKRQQEERERIDWEREHKITGTIKEVWVDHNIDIWNVGKGMMIHVNVVVNNMVNIKGSIRVDFYLQNGTQLKDNNGHFTDLSGNVVAFQYITPPYKTTAYNDLKIDIPYSELHLGTGQYIVKFRVGIYYNYYTEVTHSDWCNFSINN
jgi:hypothetical protein